MNICILFPFWVGLAFFFGRNKENNYVSVVNKKHNETKKIGVIAAAITILPVFLFVVFQDINTFAGGDYWGYVRNYLNFSKTFTSMNWSVKEPGFDVIRIIIKSLFGNSEIAFRFSIAFLQIVPIVYIFRKYSINYYFTVFLFITNGLFLNWMMNGIRQFLAVCLVFAFTPFLIKKNSILKYLILILVILAAYTIHNSAILMVPIVFIVQGKAWNKWTVILSILMVIIFSNVGFLDTTIENVGLNYSISNIKQAGDNGTNIFRVLLSFIPVLISFIYRKNIDTNNKIINISVNMSLITFCLYVVSMFTSGVLIGRLPGYTIMYNFILLPYLLKCCVEESKSKNLTIGLVCLYFIYYCYQIF